MTQAQIRTHVYIFIFIHWLSLSIYNKCNIKWNCYRCTVHFMSINSKQDDINIFPDVNLVQTSSNSHCRFRYAHDAPLTRAQDSWAVQLVGDLHYSR